MAELPELQLNDRIAIFGRTGTGKSVLAHFLFRTIPVRLPTKSNQNAFWRIAIDITDSIVDDALTFADPNDIPWGESPSLRFLPTDISTLTQDVDTLYTNVFFHGNCWVWLDEANEVSSAHSTIPGLRKVLLQGRKEQVGQCSVTPRPVDINKSIVTQSEHLFLFPLTDIDDRNRVSKNIGMDPEEFDTVMGSLPPYGYLWFDVRSGTVFSMPPLPLEDVVELEGGLTGQQVSVG